jgi:CBS domain containing-hemolysin-like protein
VNVATGIIAANIVREVLFVPPSMPVVDLLLRMQAQHIHLALVVDEHGGIDGLVSIEDLVEEIVGEIEDEHDENGSDPALVRDGNSVIASARYEIEDAERELNVDFSLPYGEDDVDTLGGLVFAMAGRVPAKGEIIQHPNGLSFEVIEAGPLRLKKLRILGIENLDQQSQGEPALSASTDGMTELPGPPAPAAGPVQRAAQVEAA